MKNITKEIYYDLFKSSFAIQLAIALYSFSDTIIIGNFLGEVALAANMLATPIFMLISAFMEMMSIGGADLYSRAIGEGNKVQADRYYSATLAATLIIGVGTSAVLLWNVDLIVSILGANTTELAQLTKAYLSVIIYGITIMALYACFEFFTRNDGFADIAFAASLCFVLTNVGLNILFVGFMDFGIAGAAWATLIGAGSALGIVAFTAFFKSKTLQITSDFSRGDIWQVLKNGANMGTKNIYALITMVIFNNALLMFSNYIAIVVYNVIYDIFVLVTSISESIRNSIQPLVSTFFGERNNYGIRRVIELAQRTSLWLAAVIIFLLMVFPEYCSYIFGIEEPEIIEMTNLGIRIYAMSIPILIFNEVVSYYYQFIKQQRITFMVMLFKGLLFVLPCNLGMMYFFGLNGLFAGFVVTEAATAVLMLQMAAGMAEIQKYPVSRFLMLCRRDDEIKQTIELKADNDEVDSALAKCKNFMHEREMDTGKIEAVTAAAKVLCRELIRVNERSEPLLEIQVLADKGIEMIIRDNGRLLETNEQEHLKGLTAVECEYIPVIGCNRLLLKIA